MKIKPVYIYLALFAVVILVMVVTSNNGSTQIDNVESEVMPDDDIHQNLKGDSPGKGNVSSNIKHQMDMLKKAVDENPNDTAKVKQYAELLASAHNPQKAVELFNTILDKDPTRIDILLGITFAYYNMRDLDKAEEYTQKVLNINPNNKEANYNLGAIAAGRGNTSKAKDIWESVIKKFPNTPVAQVAENSIRSLN